MIWRLARIALFKMDAERVHRISILLIRIAGRIPSVLRLVSGAPRFEVWSQTSSAVSIGAGDLSFAHRVGLAAGFDKDCEILVELPSLGYSFAEIGTVTPRPQEGNPRPRLFRDAKKGEVFNRMGFNGAGAHVVAERLAIAKPKLPAGFRVGINIGKNKDTANERADHDYALAAAPFAGLADYLVINVSSPNTPGLRALQTWDALAPILESVQKTVAGWRSVPPIFLKLAPELDTATLSEIVRRGELAGLGGFVLTNTLAGVWSTPHGGELPGGRSGSALTLRSREMLREARTLTRLPLISVGGILTADEALMRRKLGADLIQVYSGWVLEGPGFPSELARALLRT